MKATRLSLILLSVLALLSAAKLGRRKKVVGALALVKAAATAAELIADQIKTQSNKQSKAILLHKIKNVEEIRQLFLNSLLSMCSHAINASSLNAGLLFHLKANFNKLKAKIGEEVDLTTPPEEDKSLEEIIDDIQETSNQLNEGQMIEKDMKKALTQHYSSNLLRNLNFMQKQLSTVLEEDEQIKEEICFGKKSLTDLEKIKQEAFEKLEEVVKKLNETENFIELLNPNSSEVKQSEQIEIQQEISELPEDKAKLQSILKIQPYWLRALKGCYYLFRFILPYMNGDLDDALTIREKLFALRNAKSGKAFLLKAWKILKKFEIKPFVFKMIKNVVGSIFDFYSPLNKIFSKIRKIIKSKREVSTLRKQTKQEISELKHDTTHKINMKTLEVLKVSYDSLFNFKILKSFVSASLQVESKNLSKPEENSNFKDICRENFYLCKLEHGLKFIEEHFNGEKVCPRDIFIAGPKDNEEVLTEHRFVPLEGNAGIVGKFRIYENFFFSVSKTSILRIVTADSTDKDAVKKEFIKEVERKAKYWKQDCGSSLESEISVEKLNSKADNIYVIIAENKLMAQCKVLYTAFCVDLVKLLLKAKIFLTCGEVATT